METIPVRDKMDELGYKLLAVRDKKVNLDAIT